VLHVERPFVVTVGVTRGVVGVGHNTPCATPAALPVAGFPLVVGVEAYVGVRIPHRFVPVDCVRVEAARRLVQHQHGLLHRGAFRAGHTIVIHRVVGGGGAAHKPVQVQARPAARCAAALKAPEQGNVAVVARAGRQAACAGVVRRWQEHRAIGSGHISAGDNERAGEGGGHRVQKFLGNLERLQGEAAVASRAADGKRVVSVVHAIFHPESGRVVGGVISHCGSPFSLPVVDPVNVAKPYSMPLIAALPFRRLVVLGTRGGGLVDFARIVVQRFPRLAGRYQGDDRGGERGRGLLGDAERPVLAYHSADDARSIDDATAPGSHFGHCVTHFLGPCSPQEVVERPARCEAPHTLH
jgi:hypothetical protein